jgi:superfamily II DNA or RNA helicase
MIREDGIVGLAAAEKPKQLYHYQEHDIDAIFERIRQKPIDRLLYQLPTGGGKTVIFSEITKRFIEKFNRKVVVLTHRTELSRQTSKTLGNLGVKNKIINSSVSRLSPKNDYDCYVAMVETLKNRIKSKKIATDDVGLIIIDEAHHNSFRKLLGNFTNAFIIGVTATPFSSDISLPMYKTYNDLITGESIDSLVEKGFLAKPITITYGVEINTLKTGIHGDYTVATSDALYSSQAMLDLLLTAYEKDSKNKKTLIFNNGIFTSRKVCDYFTEKGYQIRHLDNKTPAVERSEILKWFKKTKGAILTSVSILTTGFDEPSVQTVLLNRATTSLALYFQMIGRGSRKLPRKPQFNIIDLGNNTERFGEWRQPIDWKYVFENPEAYHEKLSAHSNAESTHAIPSALRSKFPHTLNIGFDVLEKYNEAVAHDRKPKTVIQQSIRQQALMCIENSTTVSEAIALSGELDPEVDWRIKQYTKCIENASKNYRDWLAEDYRATLRLLIRKIFRKKMQAETA